MRGGRRSPAHCHPQLSVQSHRRDLQARAPQAAGQGGASPPRDLALGRNLRRVAPQGAARLHRALLSRGHNHLQRTVEVVRRGWLAPGHVRVSSQPALAARRHGSRRIGDLHVHKRAHSTRGRDRVPGRRGHRRLPPTVAPRAGAYSVVGRTSVACRRGLVPPPRMAPSTSSQISRASATASKRAASPTAQPCATACSRKPASPSSPAATSAAPPRSSPRASPT